MLLRRVLASWLAGNGSWEATARDLDLHRNTVRRHLGTIAQLLELDLEDVRIRTDLWVALQFADRAIVPRNRP